MSYMCIIEDSDGYRYAGDSRLMSPSERIVGPVVINIRYVRYFPPARVESSLDYQIGDK